MRRLSKKRRIRDTEGVVLVEFALSIPVLLGLLFFTIEFGNVFFITNSINNIANNAARYAAIYPSASESTLLDKAGSNAAIDNTALVSLSVTPTPGSSRVIGDPIIVVATYTYTPTFNPFIFFNSGNGWNPSIMSTATARVEITNE